MKTKFIIANWKENPESLDICNKLLQISENFHKYESNPEIHYSLTHAVPSIFAGLLIKNISEKPNIILQNISAFEGGSHTGEISSTQAKNIGIEMSIVGHSETRLSPENPHGDENKQVNLKIKNLFKENLWACLCIGEYKREESFDFLDFLKNQITECLLDIENIDKLCIAYEPVWAIGKNALRPATNKEIEETILFIKNFLNEKYSQKNIKVLYGGSVDENNVKEILNIDCVDGALIGRASSDPEKWQKLLGNLL